VLASLTVLTLSPSATAAAPQVRLSPAAGAAGGVIVLDGSGFPAARRVRVGLAGHRGLPLRATAAGTYQARLTVPGSRRGWVTIVTRSRGTRIVSRFFAASGAPESVEFAGRRGRLRATPGTVVPGAVVRLRGLGYRPGRRLRLSWAGATGLVTVNRRGRFVVDLDAPLSITPGAWPGTLTGRGVRLSFALQVAAPPAPAPPAPAPAPAAAPATGGPDPVAIWHMDEAAGSTVAHDPIGGHDGTLHAVTAGISPGLLGNAFFFNGAGWISIPSAPALNPGAANFTVTIHLRTVRAPATPDWDIIRTGVYDSAGGEFKVEYQPTGQASCGFIGSQGSREIIAGPALNDGAWHAVQCVKTATAVALVVDGQAFSQAARIGSIANSADLVIGAHPGSEFFIGSLDEASVVVG